MATLPASSRTSFSWGKEGTIVFGAIAAALLLTLAGLLTALDLRRRLAPRVAVNAS